MNYDYRELCIKIIILMVLYNMIEYYPNLHIYKDETRFNFYRSLMCFAFTCIGFHVGINHLSHGISHPFSYKHRDIDEIQYIFVAYLIVDLLKLIATNSTRWDLYAHHIIAFIAILLSLSIDKYGYLHAIVLICESISIVTGPDSMAMEENDNYKSYKFKLFRKNIIKYIRIPMWITIFIFTLKYTHKCPPQLWYSGITTPIVMILLDLYWSNKCDKVINKYEK
jgi:hypothetical protein